MAVCDPCLNTDEIPVCTTALTLGNIATFNTPVFVYIRDNSTDRTERYQTSSGIAGAVTIALQDEDFMPGHSYEAWITLANATSIEDKETITVGAGIPPTTASCLYLRFKYVKDTSGANLNYTIITVSEVL